MQKPSMSWRGAGPIVVAFGTLGLALAASGCGVPTSTSPQTLASVPAALTAKAPPPFTGRQLGSSTCKTKADHAFVYFVGVGINKLVPVPICIKPTSQELLAALLAGPSRLEQAAGYLTGLPVHGGASIVRVPGEKPDTVTVSLGPSFSLNIGLLQLAQIVFTLTVGPVKKVVFEDQGAPMFPPTQSSLYATGPVTRADYSSLSITA